MLHCAQGFDDGTGGGGAVECIKVDTWSPIGEQLRALGSGEGDAEGFYFRGVVFEGLQAEEEGGVGLCAAQLGNTLSLLQTRHRQNPRDDRHPNARLSCPLSKGEEASVVKKEL